MMPPSTDAPNPSRFFAEDQELNGRLRDITVSPDGRQLFLINNNTEGVSEKITVYTAQKSLGVENALNNIPELKPNPVQTIFSITNSELVESLELYDLMGTLTLRVGRVSQVDVSDLPAGSYLARIQTISGEQISRLLLKL
jgi:hypothetical protein